MSSEESLIYAVLLDGKGGGRHLDWDGVRSWKPEQGVLWVHLHAEHPETKKWITAESGLDAIISESLLELDNNPRIVSESGTLLATFRGINLNRGAAPEDMAFVNMWADSSRIITVRSARLRSAQEIIKDFDAQKGPKDTGGLLVSLLDRLHDRMEPVLDEIESEMDEFEKKIAKQEDEDVREHLLDIRTELIELRRFLSPQRRALQELCVGNLNLSWLPKKQNRQIREIEETLNRYISELDGYRERAAVIKEELESLTAERMNRAMYMLAVITGVFLPLGFLTGLLGINVGGMPGVDSGRAFWIVCGLLVLITATSLFIFKKKKWI